MSQPPSGRSSGVEHNLAKVGVESSNLFARSRFSYIGFSIFSTGSLSPLLPLIHFEQPFDVAITATASVAGVSDESAGSCIITDNPDF